VLVVAEALTDAGALFREVEVPGIEAAVEANRVVVTFEAFATHQENLERRGDEYLDASRGFLLSGRTLTLAQYDGARQVRAEFRQTLSRLFSHVDAVLMPGSPGPAVRIEEHAAAVEQSDFDGPWNLIGPPAVTFPCGSRRPACRSQPSSSAGRTTRSARSDWPTRFKTAPTGTCASHLPRAGKCRRRPPRPI
jgi:Asp-tRNA(Asn)/Glu-tRNA(Gln) amidotransferase A subunit family amidase